MQNTKICIWWTPLNKRGSVRFDVKTLLLLNLFQINMILLEKEFFRRREKKRHSALGNDLHHMCFIFAKVTFKTTFSLSRCRRRRYFAQVFDCVCFCVFVSHLKKFTNNEVNMVKLILLTSKEYYTRCMYTHNRNWEQFITNSLLMQLCLYASCAHFDANFINCFSFLTLFVVCAPHTFFPPTITFYCR